ncbi:MAG: hypothetical protein QME28_02190 [Candidatus Saccharicenans sp.]|nr:hypothetical protein [Candidatus Saccharicenans sp.]
MKTTERKIRQSSEQGTVIGTDFINKSGKIVNRRFLRPLIREKLSPLATFFLLINTLILCPLTLVSQTTGQNREYEAEELRVFLRQALVPVEELREKIEFAVFVTGPEEANVAVEATEETRNGQRWLIITFTGQKEFAGKKYHSELTLPPGADPEKQKNEISKAIRTGLVPLAGRTPAASRMKIRLEEEVRPTAVVDPWDFWVFSLSANSFLNGEKSYSYQSVYGNFSASRVTPEWKIRLSISGNFYQDKFNYEDQTFTSKSHGYSFRALIAKSLGEHWSIGSFASVTSSTYRNIKFSSRLEPAIEYNFFPYSQSTRRQLRLTYSFSLGPAYYFEETIFDRTKEFLVQENLSLTLELKQKWGTITTGIESSHYFHDLSKYRLEFNTDLSVRLFRGFSVNVYGSYSRIHDLISIAKAGASWEDVLLMRKQLATSYDYYFSVGLSYSWGSIFSRVVNPRFGSGSSGFSMTISH